MPKNFYQIQTKFRDEIRPRFGLMRAKEFIMKDAYSFDATDEGAQESYRKMYEAYVRIFHAAVSRRSQSRPIPASWAASFLTSSWSPRRPARTWWFFARDAVMPRTWRRRPVSLRTQPWRKAREARSKKFPTPGAVTIDALAQAPYNVPPGRQIKTLVYIVEGKLGPDPTAR